MGECTGEDAVEEAVPHHGIVPQPDPDCPAGPRGETTETQVSKRSKGRGGWGKGAESILRGSTGA